MCPVLSARIQNSAVLTPISASDSNQSSYGWRPRFQVSNNERPEYTALITGFQIGIRRGARPFQMRSSFMKRSQNLNNSQELKANQKNLKTRSCS
jgi:hypothetical protein